VLRGVVLPAALAALWRVLMPAGTRNWPLGLDALFRTDLPVTLAGLALARGLAYRLEPAPRLMRLELYACLLFLPAAALPLLPLRLVHLANAATGLFAAMVLVWTALSLGATAGALLTERLPSRTGSIALFLSLASVFLAVGRYTSHVAAPTGDEPHYLVVAHSLWEDHDLDLANDFASGAYRQFYPAPLGPRPWDVKTPDGRIYSWNGAVFPAVLALPYGLGGRSGVVVLLNLIAAAALLQGYRLGCELGADKRRALAATVAAALTLPVAAYSSLIYPETLAALLLLCALRAAARPAVSFAFLLALAVLRAKYLALALPAGLVLGRGSEGRALRVLAVFVSVLLAYLAVDHWVLGGVYTGRLLEYFQSSGRFVLAQRRLEGLAGIWLDQEGGLLFYNPLLLAALVRLPRLALRSRVGAAIGASVTIYSLALAAYQVWFAEWSSPGRFLVPVVLLLPVVWSAGSGPRDESRPGSPIPWSPLYVFGALQAALLCGALILSPVLAYNYADGTASVLEAVEQRLHLPVCRYFPSFIRPSERCQFLALAVAALGAAVIALPSPGRARSARHRRLGETVALGSTLFLLVWSVPLWGPRFCPTTVLEAEDGLIRTHEASLWPEIRPYYARAALGDPRMGRRLPPGAWIAGEVSSPPALVQVFVAAASTNGDGRLEVSLGRRVRTILHLPEGQWGRFGVYTAKGAGRKELKLRNVGTTEILVDRIELFYR
jgi:hypothetical protein